MSWIVEPTAAGAAAYDRDRATLGYVANYTLVFARRPAVPEAWRGLTAAVKEATALRRYGLATLAAALRLRSSYCAPAHGQLLAAQFVGAAAVPGIVADPATAELAPVDRAVMRPADKVAAG